MVQNLTIKNFKSIKDLNISCKKLNVFIGEPNSGKSNIIEALSLLSQNAFGQELNKEMFRYKSIGDLFFDFAINNPIKIGMNDRISVLKYSVRTDGIIENQFDFKLDSKVHDDKTIKISHDGKVSVNNLTGSTNVRLYEYKRLPAFISSYYSHLAVPHGENLPNLLLANSELKKWVSEFVNDKGLKLTLKPTENDINFSKIIDEEIYSYPYFSISETLQRVIFYTVAIKSNSNAVLLLDEPESNTFPFYTKELAERIALDETNQFFVTTHNPYLLLSLIEKSKEENISIFITQMKNFRTIVNELTAEQISEVLDLNSDVFFNFDKILSL